MTYKTLKAEIKTQTLTITLNRPDVRNAFNDELISELTTCFQNEVLSNNVSLVLLKGEGKVFSAGGDLKWMKDSINFSREENFKDAQKLSSLLYMMNTNPKPLIASVHGAALGGGMGLISVCDYVLAEKNCVFGFTECRLGLIPATIGSFVIDKIGDSHARSLFLSAERFDAHKANQIGLVHQITNDKNELDAKTELLLNQMLQNADSALKVAKKFIFEIKNKSDVEKQNYASNVLADLRISREAQSRIKAFLNKKP